MAAAKALSTSLGTLVIRDSVIADNAAVGVLPVGGHGGGIYNYGGTANIANSVISGNTAVEPGGGVYTCCDGTTTLNDTEVTGNSPDDVAP